MDDDGEPGTGPEAGNDPGFELEPPKPTPMGRNFYLVMALIGFLLFLIVFFNIPATRASAATTLMTTNWTLNVYANPTGVLVPVLNGTNVTAQFHHDGTVTGSSGCNRYFATYTVKEYALTIDSFGSTKMYCRGPGVMEQETAYLSCLTNTSAIRIHGSDLNVYDTAGKMILVYVPAAQ